MALEHLARAVALSTLRPRLNASPVIFWPAAVNGITGRAVMHQSWSTSAPLPRSMVWRPDELLGAECHSIDEAALTPCAGHPRLEPYAVPRFSLVWHRGLR